MFWTPKAWPHLQHYLSYEKVEILDNFSSFRFECTQSMWEGAGNMYGLELESLVYNTRLTLLPDSDAA
jgi:hypothetical protein